MHELSADFSCKPILFLARLGASPRLRAANAERKSAVKNSVWGVVENRSAQPVYIVETVCIATPDSPDRLRMTQHLTYGDGSTRVREWSMRRVDDEQYEAAASDMIGAGIGTVSGRAFQWSWVLATKPGDSLFDVKPQRHSRRRGLPRIRATRSELPASRSPPMAG